MKTPGERDRFLVCTVAVDEKLVTAVQEAKEKQQDQEVQVLLNEFWQKRQDIENHSVGSRFILPNNGTFTKQYFEEAGKPNKNVTLTPTELVFDLSSSDLTTIAALTITNTTNENLSFKIKTTKPSRYIVKPNQDLLLIGASVEIHIQLKSSEVAAIMKAPDKRDKFLVCTVAVDEKFVTAVQEAKEKKQDEQVQVLFHDLWQSKVTENRRVYCNFIPPTTFSQRKENSACCSCS